MLFIFCVFVVEQSVRLCQRSISNLFLLQFVRYLLICSSISPYKRWRGTQVLVDNARNMQKGDWLHHGYPRLSGHGGAQQADGGVGVCSARHGVRTSTQVRRNIKYEDLQIIILPNTYFTKFEG